MGYAGTALHLPDLGGEEVLAQLQALLETVDQFMGEPKPVQPAPVS